VSDNYRFFDDGEPGGTAGRPILSAIEGRDLDRVLVVVTRFFGGIKLGAGGLVRAYGGTASKCLQSAELIEIKEKAVIEILAQFDSVGAIYSLLDDFGCEKMDEKYGESGVELTIKLDRASVTNLEVALKNVTRGRATLNWVKKGVK
jgi:putative IMPACT (imprinted ancient) family translation regulator